MQNGHGVPFDLSMLLCLHSLWKARTSVRHVDVNITSRENFVESVSYIHDACLTDIEPPIWVYVLDELIKLKKF